MKIKTVKVSDKGQIAIPLDIREDARINKGDELIIIHDNGRIMIEKAKKISMGIKDNFKDLKKHSEKVARKLWENDADEVWNSV